MRGEVAGAGSANGSAKAWARTACSVSPAAVLGIAVVDQDQRAPPCATIRARARGRSRRRPGRSRGCCLRRVAEAIGNGGIERQRLRARARSASPSCADQPLAPAGDRSRRTGGSGSASKNSLATTSSGPSFGQRRRGRRASRARGTPLRLHGAQRRAGLDEMDRRRRARPARIARSASAASVPRPGPSST